MSSIRIPRSKSQDRRQPSSPTKDALPFVITGCTRFRTEQLPLLKIVHQDLPKPKLCRSVLRKLEGGLTKSLSMSAPRGRDSLHRPPTVRKASSIPKLRRPLSCSKGDAHHLCLASAPLKLKASQERPAPFKEPIDYEEKDYTCAICLEILYRPRELSCGHAFCLTCLQSYSNTCSAKFTCPSCRRVISLPSNGVSGLPRNSVLEGVAERLSDRKNALTNQGQICLKCQSDAGVTECGHCRKGWCFVCLPSHLKELKEEFTHLRRCLQESKERLLCTQEEQETRFNKLEEKIKGAMDLRREELMSKVQSLRETNKGKVTRLSKEIETTLNDLFQRQSDEQQTSLDIAWKQYNEVNQLLTSLNTSSESRLTFDASSLTLSSSPPNSNAPNSNSNSISISNSSNSNSSNSSSNSNANSSSLSNSSSFSSSNTNSNSNSTEEIDNEVCEDDRIISQRDNAVVYRTKSMLSKCRWGQNICSRPSGIALSPSSGFLYVTASDSCKIHIFDENGKHINSFGSRGHRDGSFLCPTGIAFSFISKEVYITDKWKHCIHVFDPEGRFLRQMGKKGKGFGEFSSPEGIATDRMGKIYVADTCNDRVQILDSDGVFLNEVGLVSSEILGHGRRYVQREFNEPVDVAASADGAKIYVADSGNHRIRVFDGVTGERLLMFGSRGRNKGQFESPESVLVDEDGFVIVGDSGNGRVQIFRPNGRFIRCLGARGNKRGEFGWVSGLALTKTKDLLVTDFKNNTIAAF